MLLGNQIRRQVELGSLGLIFYSTNGCKEQSGHGSDSTPADLNLGRGTGSTYLNQNWNWVPEFWWCQNSTIAKEESEGMTGRAGDSSLQSPPLKPTFRNFEPPPPAKIPPSRKMKCTYECMNVHMYACVDVRMYTQLYVCAHSCILVADGSRHEC